MKSMLNLYQKARSASPLVIAALLLTANPASAQSKFVVQHGSPVYTLDLIGQIVAQQAGFYKEEGLDVEIRNTANASTALQLVASNSADVTHSTVEPMLFGYENGIRGKIIIQTNQRVIYSIAVPASSKVTNVQDLKGLKIGVSNLGSASLIVAKTILADAKIPATQDTFVPVGVGDQALVALRSDKVQALSLWDGPYGAMERSGQPLRYFRHPALAGYGNFATMTSDSTLAAKRKELCGYGRGMAKGTLFAIENPEAALQMYWVINPGAKIAAGDTEGMKKAVAEMRFSTDAMNKGFAPNEKYGVIDEPAFKRYAELIFKDKNALDKMPPIANIQTNALSSCINDFDRAAVRKIAREWKK
jgi:NitT/TauT family transport system substrate-binding protein